MTSKKIDPSLDFTDEEEEVFKPRTVSKKLSLDERVVKQYALGMNVSDIMETNNISSGRFYDILNQNDVERRNSKSKTARRLSKLSHQDRFAIVDAYEGGEALTSIYERHGINKHELYTILDHEGAPRRGKEKPTDLSDIDATPIGFEPKGTVTGGLSSNKENKSATPKPASFNYNTETGEMTKSSAEDHPKPLSEEEIKKLIRTINESPMEGPIAPYYEDHHNSDLVYPEPTNYIQGEPRFIPLTHTRSRNPMRVEARNVVATRYSPSEGATLLIVSGGQGFYVDESPDTIEKLIAEAVRGNCCQAINRVIE